VHKRGNESWSIGCLLCNHCNDVMPYHSLKSRLTHWLDHSPTPVRLQYPIPQPFVRPHHCRAESDAHTPQHRQQSSLFSLSHIMFACMPAHHSSLSLSRRPSCTLHAGLLPIAQILPPCHGRPRRNRQCTSCQTARSGSSIKKRQDRDQDARPERWKSWNFRTRLSKGAPQRA
jgi:hypothetical protein